MWYALVLVASTLVGLHGLEGGLVMGPTGFKGISPYFSYSEDGVETINLSYGPREGSGILRICRLYICTLSYQESLLRILMPNM